MGYMHIDNLYKDQTILLFRECYALEKIHGTSAHIGWKPDATPRLTFFSGGVKHEEFLFLFDQATLEAKFEELLGATSASVYGEAYGGKCQHMQTVYGPKLRFVAFDVEIHEHWLNVPNAQELVLSLGLEFVGYDRTIADEDSLNTCRDLLSVQAFRNGMGDQPREGIVIRPLVEMMLNNGKRVIAKHKSDAFAERAHPPKDLDQTKLEVLQEASEIAQEWVTPMRLQHVLDKMPSATDVAATGMVIRAMHEDVAREATGEIEMSSEACKAIGKRTAWLFKEYLKLAGINNIIKGDTDES